MIVKNLTLFVAVVLCSLINRRRSVERDILHSNKAKELTLSERLKDPSQGKNKCVLVKKKRPRY